MNECACCAALPRFAGDTRRPVRWLDRSRPVELMVVSDEARNFTTPMFLQEDGSLSPDFCIIYSGPRRSIPTVTFYSASLIKMTPEKLFTTTRMRYRRMDEDASHYQGRNWAQQDDVALQLSLRIFPYLTRPGSSCLHGWLNWDMTVDWDVVARGVNWALRYERTVIEYDLERSMRLNGIGADRSVS